jgi:beta-1,4-mannosyl-glycoprotein beta-1,4-N-acetylglucosaminyltransferase
MKIFDCFKFFNELELLELRLMTLDPVVDYFVLVEANLSHTGKPKEFIFDQNKEMFSKWMDKIIHVKVEDLPMYSEGDIWKAENFQRNCIQRGLKDHVRFGDKVIISDVDEIPNPDTILANLSGTNPIAMSQYLFYYHVNCLQNQRWGGSVMATYPYYGSPQDLRNRRTINPIPNGGWHYSFMGGPERVSIKVNNIAESHLIRDQVGTIEEIKAKIETQTDLWNRTEEYAQKQLVDITQPGLAPKCMNEFLDKYPDFYYGER